MSLVSVLGRTHPHATADGERCPWCNQPVPREKFEEISTRIAAQERQQYAEALARSKEEAAREAALAITAAREQAHRAALLALEPQLAEAEALKAELAALKASDEAALTLKLAEQREALEAANTAALAAERLKAFEDKQKLEAKLLEMQRQIQNKTAGELGELGEVDLFEELKRTFAGDRIVRIEKGAAGPDIIQDVLLNGKVCGRIVYDAKNRGSWRNEYVTKLRQDQLTAKAEHAILASRQFPQGARQVHLQDGVIVVEPQRAIVIADLLRRHLVQTHALRIGSEARAEKSAALYAFITSEQCTTLLASVMRHSEKMLELDEAERRAHDKTWKDREKLVRSVQRVHGDLSAEIERIIGIAGDA